MTEEKSPKSPPPEEESAPSSASQPGESTASPAAESQPKPAAAPRAKKPKATKTDAPEPSAKEDTAAQDAAKPESPAKSTEARAAAVQPADKAEDNSPSAVEAEAEKDAVPESAVAAEAGAVQPADKPEDTSSSAVETEAEKDAVPISAVAAEVGAAQSGDATEDASPSAVETEAEKDAVPISAVAAEVGAAQSADAEVGEAKPAPAEESPAPPVDEPAAEEEAVAQVGAAQPVEEQVGEAQPVPAEKRAALSVAAASAVTPAAQEVPWSPADTPTADETEPASGGSSTGRTVALIVGGIIIVLLIILAVQALAGGGDSGGGEAAPAPPVGSNIIINEPVDGAILDIATPISASGTGAGLPEGNLVVQALDANNVILAEQPTTIRAADAGTGGEGPWSVQLSVNTVPGSTGRIRAFSSSPADGATLADTSVSVTYGQAPVAQPAITIDIPQPGEVVSPVEVIVTGTATDLPEDQVHVSALDAGGAVLAAQTVGVGRNGTWNATLQLNATPGSTGQITAVGGSSADQSVAAQAAVNVTYGQGAPPPQAQSSILIISPPADEVVDPTSLQVVGLGSALPENSIVVRALDANGAVLAEQATTVDAELGGSGEWRVLFALEVPRGTPGQIHASSTSPADGTIVAEASVNVQYGRATDE